MQVIGWSMWFSEYIFSESFLLSEKECRSFLSLRFWKPSMGNSWVLLCQEKTYPFPRSRISSLLPRDERKFKVLMNIIYVCVNINIYTNETFFSKFFYQVKLLKWLSFFVSFSLFFNLISKIDTNLNLKKYEDLILCST